MPTLSKLDKALDVIADVFNDPADGKINKDGSETEPRNRQAWAQRDVIQAIAWKANAALDRQMGPDERMAGIRAAAAAMAETPSGEIDMVQAQRIAQDAEFWSFQQSGLEALLKAASACLERHGHDAYTRQDLTKRRTVSSDNAAKSQADVAAIFSGLGVTLPNREA